MLLDIGLDLMFPDKFGNTIVHVLVELGRERCLAAAIAGVWGGKPFQSLSIPAVKSFKEELDECDDTTLGTSEEGRAGFGAGTVCCVCYAEGLWSGKLAVPGRVRRPEGVDLEVVSRRMETPLGVAVRCGNLPLAKMLVEAGASTHTLNSDRQSLLAVAAKKGNVPMVKWLLDEVGAGSRTDPTHRFDAVDNMDAVDDSGFTALGLALRYKQYEVALLLFQAGACVMVRPGALHTALHLLATNGVVDDHVESMWPYLARVLDAQDLWKQTALHIACHDQGERRPQDSGFALWLLAHGAAPDARNAEGRTPLMLAVCAEKVCAVKQLAMVGADLNAHSPSGATALLIACQQSTKCASETLEVLLGFPGLELETYYSRSLRMYLPEYLVAKGNLVAAVAVKEEMVRRAKSKTP